MKATSIYFFFFFVCAAFIGHAQELSGNYQATGYFFHPTLSRALADSKTLTQVGPSTYEVNTLGDLPGWGFRFTIDTGNNLVGWVATGFTPLAPGSGFMTSDNPGGFTYLSSDKPGTDPWVHATYNNKYDPATRTFYLHYGYNAAATGQAGYDRQVYEQYVFTPPVNITSVTPLTGTAFSEVSIEGSNFLTDSLLPYAVSFGGALADTLWAVSHDEIRAKVGAGASGTVQVMNNMRSIDTLPGFVYTPVPPVINPGWSYLGNAGFSPNKVSFVSAASGSDDVPYVCFVDSLSGRARVMKFNGNRWVGVGPFVSEGACGYTDIAINKNNLPIVAYADLQTGGITVKAFAAGKWLTLGNAAFAPVSATAQYPFSMVLDTSDVPCILTFDEVYPAPLTVYRLRAGSWAIVGEKGFASSSFGDGSLAIDRLTNSLYVVFADANAPNHNASVMRFNGRKWVLTGNAGFTQATLGAFYPDIVIDSVGRPLVVLQEDNGFERLSVYRFGAGNWSLVGPQRFSKSRSYYASIVLDRKGLPYVLFRDGSYNNQGTILRFSKTSGSWDTLGARGFIPNAEYLGRQSLFFTRSNKSLVAFADKTNDGKLSVMQYDDAALLKASPANSNIVAAVPNLRMYPNPAHNQLTVQVSNSETVSSLRVLDMNGRVVIDRRLNSKAGSSATLDVAHLVPGSYTLSVKTTNGAYSGLFIKQ